MSYQAGDATAVLLDNHCDRVPDRRANGSIRGKRALHGEIA